MLKLNDLKEKRAQLYEEMKALTEVEEMSQEDVDAWTSKKEEVEKLDKQIEMAEEQEKINIKLAGMPMRNQDDGETKDQNQSYSVAWNQFITGNGIADDFKANDGGLLVPNFLYADPVLSTTATGIRNSLTDQTIRIRDGRAKQWLDSLGVTQYTGVNGTFDLPRMPNYTAGFVSEAADVSTANIVPTTNQLTPRAVGHHNSFSQAYDALTNPTFASQMIQHLVDGVWDAIVTDLFVQIKADAPGQVGTPTAGGLTLADINVMDSSIIGFRSNLGYVTNRNVKAYLQQLDVGSAGIKFAWSDGNTLSGIPAKVCDYLPANHVYYSANWADAAVALFGDGLSMIIDPYSASNSHQTKVVIRGLADTGVGLPTSFTYMPDVSAAI